MSCRRLRDRVMNRPGFLGMGLCLCFILAFLFSENYTASHGDHDCYGAECPVCLSIRRAEIFFRHVKSAVFYPGFPAGAPLTVLLMLPYAVFCFVLPSSVRLKIKMNR
jgi:hypothetical protein